MKVITITEENIKSVYGKLRKFFYNRNQTGFEEWHNFDCGFGRISPYIHIDGNKIRNIHKYPAPDEVMYYPKGTVPGISSYGYIVIRLTATDCDSLRCGDKIAFCGNRIVYRTKATYSFRHRYIYSVFQVLPMSKRKQEQKKWYAEQEAKMYERLLF